MNTDHVRALAFCVPEFRPAPADDPWWMNGFEDWLKVARARPRFEGHRQPRIPGALGFYDPRSLEARKAQAALAREYGIQGFCYYYRALDLERNEQHPLSELLRATEPDFPFCLCWDRSTNDATFVARLLPYFRDPRYIRVDGRPMLVIYRPDLIDDVVKTVERWRRAFRRRGIGDVYLIGGVNSPSQDFVRQGFDAEIQIPPFGMDIPVRTAEFPVDANFSGAIHLYQNIVQRQLRFCVPNRIRFFTATLAWDSTPQSDDGRIYHGFSVETYEQWLTAAVLKTAELYPASEQFVFVNAWNDWINGAYLEPDLEFGFAPLEATRRALTGTADLSPEFCQHVLQLARAIPHVSAKRRASLQTAASDNAFEVFPEDILRCIRESPLNLVEWCHHNLQSDSINDDTLRERYLSKPVGSRPRLSPYFDPRFYLVQNPDVERSGMDPYAHFLIRGFAENRDPHPLINLRWMFERFETKFPFRKWTLAELARLLNENELQPHPLFDLDRYVRTDPAIASQRVPAFRHFLEHGAEDGRLPNEFFDYDSYRARYSDVPRSRLSAFLHFAEGGDLDTRRPGPMFDPEAYSQRYPDAIEAADHGFGPLAHFLSVGRERGYRAIQVNVGGVWLEDPTVPEPVDVQRSETIFEVTSSMLRQVDRGRIEQFRERALSYVDETAKTAGLGKSLADPARDPRVSIIIPVYGHLPMVRECLISLFAALAVDERVEVIVADDKPDESVAILQSEFPCIRYFSNHSNVGFLNNCNKALLAARGQEILLLNSDVQVPKGFLSKLLAVLDQDSRIGIVGPKLIYPNGRLQEAGCALNLDGSAIMIGVGDDPDVADYCRTREVDYCSGACLLIRRRALDEAGGRLDPRYAPSYCEDADLCLAVRSAGWRVVYCDEVSVIHRLSASHDGIGQHVKVERSIRNQEKLFQKWSGTLAQLNRIRAIAFYLPQFHRIRENDLWWGTGFTEWSNVAKARPNFKGHYQPHLPADLGFYDLDNSAVMREQAELAARYGVDGFCLYYYNFGGRTVLDRPLRNLAADPTIPFRYCLCWANENWTKNWDGGERQILLAQPNTVEAEQKVIEDVVRYLGDGRYIRIDGRPFFLVYRPFLLRDAKEFASRLRVAAREAGLGEIVLGAVEGMDGLFDDEGASRFGFDIAVEFAPHGAGAPMTVPDELVNDKFSGTVNSYGDALRRLAERRRKYSRMRCVFPNWDNTPRRQNDGLLFYGSSPEAFEAHAEYVIRKTREQLFGEWRMFFINAWNEWAEGAHLEPDHRYGHRWLEAIRNAKVRAGAVL